jgi:hypothetical protein
MESIITRFTERFSAHNMSGGRPVAVNCAESVRLCGRFEVESHDEMEATINGINSLQCVFYIFCHFFERLRFGRSLRGPLKPSSDLECPSSSDFQIPDF